MTPSASLPRIDSPCRKVCAIDPTFSICVGCGRTVDEIANWIGYSSERRSQITTDLPRRLTLQRTPASSGSS